MPRLLRPLALLLALLLPASPALAQASGGFSFPGSAITLDVASIEVDVVYVPPMKDPHVEHVIAVSPTDAVRLWTQSRLKAGGRDGTAKVVIRQAPVVEEELERTSGVKGWFTKDQSEKYTGRLAVEIVLQNPARGLQGQASASVARSISVAEDISLAEREKVMLGLVRDLAADLDAQLSQAVRTHLAPAILN